MERAWVGGVVVGLFVLGAWWVAGRHEASAPPPRSVAGREPAAEAGPGTGPGTGAEPEGEPRVDPEPVAAPSPEKPAGPFPGARAVFGRTTGRYGAIWGVRVTAYGARTGQPFAWAETDRDGAYRIELDPADPRVMDLVARRDTAEGVAVRVRRGLSWEEPGELAVDFAWASATRSAGGWVLDPTPFVPVRLFAVPSEAYRREFGDRTAHPGLLSRVPKETTKADERGLFELTGLRPGRYRLVVGNGGLMCAEPVEFEAGDHGLLVRVVLARGACVHVRDVSTGAPVETARLVLDPGGPDDARLVAQGASTLWFREPRGWDRKAEPPPLPPPDFETDLRVEADGYRSEEVPAYAARSAHVVYLLPEVPANGTVTLRLPVDRPGPRRFSVWARHVAEGKSYDLGESENGVLEAGLPPGTWELSIRLVDRRSIPSTLRRVEVGDSGRWQVALAVHRRHLVDAD